MNSGTTDPTTVSSPDERSSGNDHEGDEEHIPVAIAISKPEEEPLPAHAAPIIVVHASPIHPADGNHTVNGSHQNSTNKEDGEEQQLREEHKRARHKRRRRCMIWIILGVIVLVIAIIVIVVLLTTISSREVSSTPNDGASYICHIPFVLNNITESQQPPPISSSLIQYKPMEFSKCIDSFESLKEHLQTNGGGSTDSDTDPDNNLVLPFCQDSTITVSSDQPITINNLDKNVILCCTTRATESSISQSNNCTIQAIKGSSSAITFSESSQQRSIGGELETTGSTTGIQRDGDSSKQQEAVHPPMLLSITSHQVILSGITFDMTQEFTNNQEEGNVRILGDGCCQTPHLIVNCTFKGGNATDELFGVQKNGGNLEVKGFAGTTSTQGEEDVSLSTLVIQNSHFINGYAVDGGGGVFVQTLDRVIVDRSTFSNNHAGYGGGIVMDQVQHVTVTNSIFDSNRSVRAGGALWFETVGPNEPPSSSFDNGIGGGDNNNEADYILLNNTSTDNVAGLTCNDTMDRSDFSTTNESVCRDINGNP